MYKAAIYVILVALCLPVGCKKKSVVNRDRETEYRQQRQKQEFLRRAKVYAAYEKCLVRWQTKSGAQVRIGWKEKPAEIKALRAMAEALPVFRRGLQMRDERETALRGLMIIQPKNHSVIWEIKNMLDGKNANNVLDSAYLEKLTLMTLARLGGSSRQIRTKLAERYLNYKKHKDYPMIAAALKAMAHLKPVPLGFVSYFIIGLRHHREEIRFEAARGLARVKGSMAYGDLWKALTEHSPRVLDQVILALGQMKPHYRRWREVSPRLVRLLRHSSEMVRLRSIWALGTMQPLTTPTLRRLLKHPNKNMVQAAKRALASYRKK